MTLEKTPPSSTGSDEHGDDPFFVPPVAYDPFEEYLGGPAAGPEDPRSADADADADRADQPRTLRTWFREQITAPSPARKQGATALLFALAVVIAITTQSMAVSAVGIEAGCAVVAVGAALSVVFTLRLEWARYQALVVGLDFVAIAILRYSTGGTQSIFGALVIIPVIWMARSAGRRWIAVGALGAAVVFLVAPAFTSSVSTDPNWLLYGCFSTLVYTVAASIINELARLSRHQFLTVRAREVAYGQELDRGAEVQQALLPKDTAPLQGYEVAGRCIPAKAVGGDFYDWYPIPGGLGFTLGDVVGKGVGAGMIAATAHAVVRSARLDEDPVAALLRTDACLSTELVDVGSFTTMFHARLRAEDGRLRYADAGHGLTLHVRADGTWERLSATDLPLGLGVSANWDCHELVLEPGDKLVSFSDGVLELWDGTMVATEHIASLAATSSTANELVDAVTNLAIRTSNPDDVTVLVVRRELGDATAQHGAGAAR